MNGFNKCTSILCLGISHEAASGATRTRNHKVVARTGVQADISSAITHVPHAADARHNRTQDRIAMNVSPVLHMRRTAMEDTELGGKRIAKGDKVVLWYASGNRDESVFPEPFRFDVTRKGERQLGFGAGQHFCLGSRLAELQLKVIFEELLRRLPDIRALYRGRARAALAELDDTLHGRITFTRPGGGFFGFAPWYAGSTDQYSGKTPISSQICGSERRCRVSTPRRQFKPNSGNGTSAQGCGERGRKLHP